MCSRTLGLLKFLGPLLGNDFHLSNFTAVVSHPGAPIQHIHRDHHHLFPRARRRPELAGLCGQRGGAAHRRRHQDRADRGLARLAPMAACLGADRDHDGSPVAARRLHVAGLPHPARGPAQREPADAADRLHGLRAPVVLRQLEPYQPNPAGHADRALQQASRVPSSAADPGILLRGARTLERGRRPRARTPARR